MRFQVAFLVLLLGGMTVAGTSLAFHRTSAAGEAVRTIIQRNERLAEEALTWISEAEQNLGEDGDYWTGDVEALYRIWGLIPESIARADAAPLVPHPGGAKPYGGYWLISVTGVEDPPEELKTSDGWNSNAFCFCAYPVEYGRTGKRTFLMSRSGILAYFEWYGAPVTQVPKSLWYMMNP